MKEGPLPQGDAMRRVTAIFTLGALYFAVAACSSDPPATAESDTRTSDTVSSDSVDSNLSDVDDLGTADGTDLSDSAMDSDGSEADTQDQDAETLSEDLNAETDQSADTTLIPAEWPCGTPGPATHRIAGNGQLLGRSPGGHFYLLHLDDGAYSLSAEDGALPIQVASVRHDLSRFEFSPNDEWAINRRPGRLPTLLSMTGAPGAEFTLLETDRAGVRTSFSADSDRVLVQTPEGFDLLALPDLNSLLEFELPGAETVELAPSADYVLAWVRENEGERAELKLVDLTGEVAAIRDAWNIETTFGFVSNTTDRYLVRTEPTSVDYVDLASEESPQTWLQLPEGRTVEGVNLLGGGWVEVESEDEERSYTEFFAFPEADDLPSPVPAEPESGQLPAIWGVGQQQQAAVIMYDQSDAEFVFYASPGAEPIVTMLPEASWWAARTFFFSDSGERFGVGTRCGLYVAETDSPADGVWAPIEDCDGNFSWQFAGDTATVLYGSGRAVSFWDTDNPETPWSHSFGTIREMQLSPDGTFFATRDSRTGCDGGCNQNLLGGPVCDGGAIGELGTVRSGVSGTYLFPTDSNCLLYSREEELFVFVPGEDDSCP